MKNYWSLGLFGLVLCSGCTSLALEQYTVRQSATSGDVRDRLVLSCLATVAANPDALPPYAIYASGITSATDSITLPQAATWAPMKYVLQSFGLTASRQPKGQWTIDPAAEYQQLEAMHAACLWALFGPDRAAEAYPGGILGDPRHYLDGKPHFAVAERLARTVPGWVHLGRLADVPLHACYKAHCGHTWVWVMPQDSESFAQFTLVLQDIATLEPQIIASPPIVIQMIANKITRLPDLTATDGKKQVTISTSEARAVKPEYKETIEKAIQAGLRNGKINLTRAQWMAYTEPWLGTRNSAGTTSPATTTGVVTMPVQARPNVLVVPPAPAPSFSAPPPSPGRLGPPSAGP